MTNEVVESRREETKVLEPRPKAAHAWAVARGLAPQPEEPCGKVWGAKNDYNARGKGSTYVRRVYRDGGWAWLSEPASRGRFYAHDRHDVRYGDVYVGDIIAEYVLGTKEPCGWKLVCGLSDKGNVITADLEATKLKGGCWRLRVASKPGKEDVPGECEVQDPYWR